MSVFHDIRYKYIKKYYGKIASVFKCIHLLSARNFKELCYLGCYLQHAFERREIIVRSFSDWLVFVLCNIQHHATWRIVFLFYMLLCMFVIRCVSSGIKYIYMYIYIYTGPWTGIANGDVQNWGERFCGRFRHVQPFGLLDFHFFFKEGWGVCTCTQSTPLSGFVLGIYM